MMLYLFSMVSLKGTKYAFWYRDYVSYNVGIHIDFFALDNVPDSDFKCKLYYYKTRILNHLQTNAIIDMKHSKIVLMYYSLNNLDSNLFYI